MTSAKRGQRTILWTMHFMVGAAICVLGFGGQKDMSETDSFSLSAQRQRLLTLINQARRAVRVLDVQSDALADRVAQAHCEEMAQQGYVSHWNLQGLKPYHRYSLAGGVDYISENIGYFRSVPLGEATSKCVEAILAEKPPHDGHRRTLLDPDATHVGLGIAVKDEHVYIVQDFITRRVSIQPLPRFVLLQDKLTVSGRADGELTLFNISIFYEPLPQPMTPAQLRQTSSYGLPTDRLNLFRELSGGLRYSDGSRGDIKVGEDGGFRAPLRFFKQRPGIYTILVWLRKPDNSALRATALSIFACDTEEQRVSLKKRFSTWLQMESP